MKIAYQGISGAYSEAAIIKHFNATCVGFCSFEEVFNAVNNNEADLGVIPVENSIAGSVVMNYDLLLKYNVHVIGEIFLKIRHALLSRKNSNLSDIKEVYSHPHALQQCHDFLKKHRIIAKPEYDTAGSAKLISQNKTKNCGALASSRCAEIYGLKILNDDVSDNEKNTTKFFVISKKIPGNLKKQKTSIAFRTKHYSGALVNCLQRLYKNNINLTKLESRPLPDNPWEYVFYADFIGGIDEDNVKLALSEMEAASTFIKILGSYPKGEEDYYE